MPNIDVTDDLGSWMALRPEMAPGLVALSTAVYGHSQLPKRVQEIARMRIAIANECEVCLGARYPQPAEDGLDEALYANVLDWREATGYSERERLAAEYARRALRHRPRRAARRRRFLAALSPALQRGRDRRSRHLLRALAWRRPDHARAGCRPELPADAGRAGRLARQYLRGHRPPDTRRGMLRSLTLHREYPMNIAVLIVAIAFLGMGLVALVQPRRIGHYFDVRFDSVDGRNEVRAVYGGFGLAMAAALGVALREPALRNGVLFTLALALAGMALGRVLGAFVERPGRWPLVFGLLEAAGATALWMSRSAS